MRITLKNLAEKSGLSIGAISRALRDDPLIAKKTREKIRALAEEMNYIPDNLGRGLQSRHSRLIGLLISNIHDSFYAQTIQGIGEMAAAHGYGIVIGITGDDPQKEIHQLKLFLEKRVDGIILSNYQPQTVIYLDVLRRQLPLAVCDFETFSPEVPDVMVDDVGAMRMLTAHLLGLGHVRLAFCFLINSNAKKRYEAAACEAQKTGIAPPICCSNQNDLESALHSDASPTAVLGYSDFHAVQVKHVAERHGLIVPTQLSITGFDNMDFAAWPEFALTTIDQPKIELGSRAVELIFEQINSKKQMMPVRFPPRLVVRNSTVPPQSSNQNQNPVRI
ncbi:MAG: LacI family transcriptional regulator [Calditrichaeota bacterium]|nr:MAG: LacI family transcriptional regulator [Calditrichota bacterium]